MIKGDDYMQQIKRLDEKMKRVFAIKPHSLIFIKVAVTQQYNYVLQQLYRCAEDSHKTFATVVMKKDKDILEEITSINEECILVELDPLDETFLKRLDFMRERLYGSGKLLFFILYTNQYDTLMYRYPDLFEFSTLNFDYSSQINVPFTLIFSNDSLSFDRKRGKEKEDRFSMQIKDNNEQNYLYNIFLGIKKLGTMRMKVIEIDRLDAMISDLYKHEKLYENKEIVDLLFDYLDLLCMREDYERVKTNLSKMYSNFYELPDGTWTINDIFLFCMLSDSTSGERRIIVSIRTCKILMMLFVYQGTQEELTKAECINLKRTQLLKGRNYLSDNLRAETCNDTIIIQYLMKKDIKTCISDIDYMIQLDPQLDLRFLYYYNKSVLYLLDNDYRNALQLCETYLETYRSDLNVVPGMTFYRMSLIRNWIRGMFYRELDESIHENVLILQKHRHVFVENHYSIAEIHFCNAILYRELEEMEKSMHCAEKANNILRQNKSKRLERLKKLVQKFMEEQG